MPIYMDKIKEVLARFEGKQQLRGYIPCNLNTGGTANYYGGPNPGRYDPMGISGVTIGTGVDLGQTDAATLQSIGVPEALTTLFRPYLGKQDVAAVYALYAAPLSIGKSEADLLDTAMLNHHVNKIAARYDRDAGAGAFEQIPWQAQAVIVSIQYQRGVNSPSKYPNTWKAFISRDWADAAARLKNGRLWTGYQSRRAAEGKILEGIE